MTLRVTTYYKQRQNEEVLSQDRHNHFLDSSLGPKERTLTHTDEWKLKDREPTCEVV